MSNPYDYEQERLEWFERFTIGPVPPEEIERRLEGGEILETTDIPEYLAQQLITDAGTGLALYRLTQLFGTPNVPGMEAGADQADRHMTTWQYLFSARFEGDEDEPEREFYLSVYDYKTDPSAGISGFRGTDGTFARRVFEPTREPVDAVEMPEDDFLVGVVQLVLNMLDEPVPATYKNLWV